jgi:hypothetical protein
MKVYLIVGGLLLTAASVYGVTDYVQTKNKKAFKELYKEAPVIATKEITLTDIKEEDFSRGKMESFTPPEKEVVIAPKHGKTDTKKKKTKKSVYSNASVKEEIKPVAIEVSKESGVEPEATIVTKAPVEKKTLKRKITLKKFSRAAPKEEVIIEEKKQ